MLMLKSFVNVFDGCIQDNNQFYNDNINDDNPFVNEHQNSKQNQIDYGQNEYESKLIGRYNENSNMINDKHWLTHMAKYIKTSNYYDNDSEIELFNNFHIDLCSNSDSSSDQISSNDYYAVQQNEEYINDNRYYSGINDNYTNVNINENEPLNNYIDIDHDYNYYYEEPVNQDQDHHYYDDYQEYKEPVNEDYHYHENNYETDIQQYNDGTMAIIINEQMIMNTTTTTTNNNDKSVNKNIVRRPSNIGIKIIPNQQQQSIESIQVLEIPIDLSKDTQLIQSHEITSNVNDNASSINSCQTAALMLSTNGDNYVLSLNIKPSNGDDNQLNIQIPDKKIGEKLEKFLDEYGFMEYLDEEKSILNATTTTTTATNIDDNDMNKDQKFDYRILEKSIDDDDDSSKSISTTTSSSNINIPTLCSFRRRRSTTYVPTEFISHIKNDHDFLKRLNQKYNFKELFQSTTNLAHIFKRPFNMFRTK
ncbi:hypothetical protein DERF_010278 [Dermatophagoides farinae]|uniref:Uncharacterized protein n=1 Tax=Dermatophagoides farinae TaxID=6954 RepID=A0A922L1V6_DERFA|nr:hypothetical protein DERF_010278 [Dermatophagoides farinae]